jgi:hypothetical protein
MADLPLRACFKGSWTGPKNVGEKLLWFILVINEIYF